jgi:hypothetical protein
MGENNETSNQLLPKVQVGHISLTRQGAKRAPQYEDVGLSICRTFGCLPSYSAVNISDVCPLKVK